MLLIDNGNTYDSNGEKDVFCFFNYTKPQNLPNPAAFGLYGENIQDITREPVEEAVVG